MEKADKADITIFNMTIFGHDSYMIYLPDPHSSFNKEATNQIFDGFLKYRKVEDFLRRPIRIAPVVRLYGSNQFGQKCCLHIHGVIDL
jgi:hypothetical protein